MASGSVNPYAGQYAIAAAATVATSGSNSIYPAATTATVARTSTFQPTASIASVQLLADRIASLETTSTTLTDNVATVTTTANNAASTATSALSSSVGQTEVDVSSQIAGDNILFSTGKSFVQDSAAVYYNGQRLRNPSEFTEVRSTVPHKVQLTFTPFDDDSLIVVFSESP